MTSPMTPERLAEIRAHVAYNNGGHDGCIANPVEQELLAEVDRLRAQVASVERVWAGHRDAEDGTMTWRLVRDMDAALASGDKVQPVKAEPCRILGHRDCEVIDGVTHHHPEPEPEKTEVVDLVGALRASIEAAKARRLAAGHE